MMALPPEASERLAKLIPMLSSDQPGEVVAAAGAISRTLATCGATWFYIAEADAGSSRPEPLEDSVGRLLSDLDGIATHLIDRKWIARLSRFYARRGYLSERQMQVLGDIAGRCCHGR